MATTNLDKVEALRVFLNVPDGKSVGFVILKLDGPTLELFVVDDDGSMPGCPRLSLDKPLPNQDVTEFQVWRARISREGSPLFAEMVWTPARGYDYAIRERSIAASTPWKKAQTDRAIKDLLRWQALEEVRRGRPRGSGLLNRLTADQLRRDYHDYVLRTGGRPTQEQMAAEWYWVDKKTLTRWLRENGVHWPPRPKGA